MSVIDYSPIIFLILAAITYLIFSKFDNYIRKTRELDKKIGKEYTIVNNVKKTSRTYNAVTGELTSEISLYDFCERMNEHNRILYDQYLERRDDISRRALITQEQYARLRDRGYDVMGGAESHIKPPESKPKGYDVKDQFDGVP